ncbi:caspase-3-like isoform X2 [Sparus aurata]|uniref:caspase-3-like isoform X2 n=1 Tax=Sparus aurata TaxID=8175 RepID=UPI0011C1A11B|nr:caspase-3-like isoform X2 [Sparus aurata]
MPVFLVVIEEYFSDVTVLILEYRFLVFLFLCVGFSMAAKDEVRRNKTTLQTILRADHRLILNMVDEKGLLTRREYNNLKSMKGDDEGLINELLDKIMDKGDDTCRAFLELLQTDEEIKNTFPELKKIQWTNTSLLHTPVQASSAEHDGPSQEKWKPKQYELNSRPTGLCVIMNNENFKDGFGQRRGTDQDAQSLAEVFSWLGFRVLMCKDQTRDQMDQALKCFASLSDLSQLQQFSVQEWSGNRFTDLQEAPKHGDAFICSILSHGEGSGVIGIDGNYLSIKDITGTFKVTDHSTLTGKPKVFLIQGFGGIGGDCSSYLPDTDFLVAHSGQPSYRNTTSGTWFIQSVCRQLREGCSRGEDISIIFRDVIDEVSKKEVPGRPLGPQIPQFGSTLRKALVFSPHRS